VAAHRAHDQALSFVVARFSRFCTSPRNRLSTHKRPGSRRSWAWCSWCRALAALTTIQHKTVSTLPEKDLPASYSRAFAVVLSSMVGILGILLAAYLVVSHP
jgi:hypothetical protein